MKKREARGRNAGAIAELVTSIDLMRRGYFSYRTDNPSAPVDILAMCESGRVLRIEVKTARDIAVPHRSEWDHIAFVDQYGVVEYKPPLPDTC